MDPVKSPIPPDSDEPPLVIAVEEPSPRPDRPGPNIFMALAWWLLLFVTTQVIGLGAIVIIIGIAVADRGVKGLDALMQESGVNALYDVPGAIEILFLAGSGGIILVAGSLVAILYGSNVHRTMALRGISDFHFVLIVLMVLPTALVAGAIQSLAGRVLPCLEINGPVYRETWTGAVDCDFLARLRDASAGRRVVFSRFLKPWACSKTRRFFRHSFHRYAVRHHTP